MLLDNFYDDPESIIQIVRGEFPVSGCSSGKKSLDLSQLDSNAYVKFKERICSLHNLNVNTVNVHTYFAEQLYNDVDDIFNNKAIHVDGKGSCSANNYNLLFCGQIMLTKDPDPEATIKTYRFNTLDSEMLEKSINEYTIPGELYRSNKITLDEFKILKNKYNSNFELVEEISNVYNRMVSWVGGTPHNHRVTIKVPVKLDQYFFIEKA